MQFALIFRLYRTGSEPMDPFFPSPPAVRLHFIVVGGGIGGLSAAVQLSRAGHTATVLEAAEQTQDTGAGINVPPNAARLLIGIGLGDLLHDYGVHPHAIVYRRFYRTGHLTSEMFILQRGHLTRGLIELARRFEGTEVRFNSPVSNIDPGGENTKPYVVLSNGEKIEGDVIIGADGIRSLTREVVTRSNDRPLDTGDVAFRSLIPTKFMLADPDLASLVTNHEVTVWLGPGRHIVAYCINGKEQYHLALARLDEVALKSTESWVVEASPDTMREGFDGWEIRVTKLLKLVEVANKRKLVDRLPFDNWVHPSGRAFLLGDACHPMLPYRAQGAAMAMEDAATLGVLFSQLSSIAEITELGAAYAALRAPRCAQAQMASQMNRRAFHMPDGEAQEARDVKLATANPIAVEADNRTTFDYDAVKVAKAWLTSREEKINTGAS
ncbi:hypothetical protein EW145_g3105 [Phellinidium pouzarii]|uniref:FAD-binding domain-containing protein n=1 Tax=Phellinidium pouzarii TaxID=167371 RepID=A0A4S4L8K9_9AGAM|nr:hypothetical protein EW145_g3105 [Phellinidium pouzarii]